MSTLGSSALFLKPRSSALGATNPLRASGTLGGTGRLGGTLGSTRRAGESILAPRKGAPATKTVEEVAAAEQRSRELMDRAAREMELVWRQHGRPMPDLAERERELNHVSEFRLPLSLDEILPSDALPWYRKLRLLAENPDLEDFYYLCPVKDYQKDDSYSPFELVIKNYTEVDQSNFYTMSSQGVTHMLHGEADFYTLEDFEKEFFLFQTFRRFKIFRHFKVSPTPAPDQPPGLSSRTLLLDPLGA